MQWSIIEPSPGFWGRFCGGEILWDAYDRVLLFICGNKFNQNIPINTKCVKCRVVACYVSTFYTFCKLYRTTTFYLLCWGSSETLSFLRPFARRAFNTLRPLAVDILSRKPCLFLLFLFDGWNVLFISEKYFINLNYFFSNLECKNKTFFGVDKVKSNLE